MLCIKYYNVSQYWFYDSLVLRTIGTYIVLAGLMRIYFGMLPCVKARRIYTVALRKPGEE